MIEGIGIDYGSYSDVGAVRAENQDRALVAPPVFVVADGMGGHRGGAEAAQTVVDELALLAGTAVTTAQVQDRLQAANDAIAASAPEAFAPPGTTLTGALLTAVDGAPYWMVINVGDSRTYLWRGAALEQITVDHSEVQELVDAGRITAAEAETHPQRNVITRAVGIGPTVQADLWMIPVRPGDRLLACSDGVTKELSGATIAGLLGAPVDSARAAHDLVAAAVAAGGSDNATAVVVTVLDDPAASLDDDTVRLGTGTQE